MPNRRPEAVDAAQRIDHALIEEIAPARRPTERWPARWHPRIGCWPSGRQSWPRKAWIRKRPTRVPASTVVRMKSASNMMAKWYQSAISALPPSACEKTWAMPTASVGAPPARPNMVFSPRSRASAAIAPVVTGKPQSERVDHRIGRRGRPLPPGLLMAKYTPGSSVQAATMAMMATADSMQHAAVADRARVRSPA